WNRPRLVMPHNFGELLELLQAQDHHECKFELRILVSRPICRRLAQIQIQGEERSHEVVAKALRFSPPLRWNPLLVDQFQKRLLRIESRRHKVSCAKNISRLSFDANNSAIFDEDLSRPN